MGESGLEQHYRVDKTDPEGERLANLGELISSVQQYEEILLLDEDASLGLADRLYGYLEQVSLVSDVDTVSDAQGAVTLMTLHAAKGLEFPAVAMIGVEDGLLPHERAQNSEHEMEEERRLCFVGITRARRHLFMTHARTRTIFGQRTPTIASRFLRELPEAPVVARIEAEADNDWVAGEDRFANLDQQRRDARELADQYRPGELVRHAQFGLGRVLTITAAGAQTKAQVAFNTSGVKTLILQYAHLERVNI